MKRAILALAVIFVLTACAGPSGYVDHRFESTNELREVLAKAGYQCTSDDDKAKTEASLNQYGFDPMPCDDGAATIWRSDVVRREIQAKPFNALKAGQVMIEGINWSVMVPTDRLEQVNKVLKGTVK